jgi:Ankyrin repeats (3 copies)
MKIYIRYYRNFVFGNYATQGFEVDPDSLVIDLKRMIQARINIDSKYQVLRVKNHGQLEVMTDQCSINFYNVADGNFIYLENIQSKTSESEQIKETV